MKNEKLQNLLALDFNGDPIPYVLDTRLKQLGMYYFRGCFHRVLIGTQDQLDSIPQDIKSKATVLHNLDAYDNFLQMATGIRGRMRGEAQVVSQFKIQWADFEKQYPEKAKELNWFYQSILRDSALIRSSVTQDVIPAFYESAAHELLEQKQKQTILVVVGANRDNKVPSEVTINLIKQLANNRRNAAEKIIFTCPDSSILDMVYTYYLREKGQGKITSKIEKRPFDVAFDCTNKDMFKIDSCCICYQMGLNEAADKKMIEEWGQREAVGNCKLIHLGGPTKAHRHTNEMWKKSTVFNTIFPEDITKKQQEMKQQNNANIERGKRASRNCAISCAQQKHPFRDSNILTLSPERYAHRMGVCLTTDQDRKAVPIRSQY